MSLWLLKIYKDKVVREVNDLGRVLLWNQPWEERIVNGNCQVPTLLFAGDSLLLNNTEMEFEIGEWVWEMKAGG